MQYENMSLFFSETGLKIQKRVIENFQGSKNTFYSCWSQGSRVKASSQGHAGQAETGCSPSLFPWVWLAPPLFVNVFSRIVWGKWRDSNWGLTMNSVWSHFLKSKVPKSGVPDQLWNSSCYSKKKKQPALSQVIPQEHMYNSNRNVTWERFHQRLCLLWVSQGYGKLTFGRGTSLVVHPCK